MRLSMHFIESNYIIYITRLTLKKNDIIYTSRHNKVYICWYISYWTVNCNAKHIQFRVCVYCYGIVFIQIMLTEFKFKSKKKKNNTQIARLNCIQFIRGYMNFTYFARLSIWSLFFNFFSFQLLCEVCVDNYMSLQSIECSLIQITSENSFVRICIANKYLKPIIIIIGWFICWYFL